MTGPWLASLSVNFLSYVTTATKIDLDTSGVKESVISYLQKVKSNISISYLKHVT
jgi:hypothetical protein